MRAGWVWRCYPDLQDPQQAKGAVLHGVEMLRQQPSFLLEQWSGSQGPEAAASGQRPELRQKHSKWLYHCLPSAGQIRKDQAEVMSGKT